MRRKVGMLGEHHELEVAIGLLDQSSMPQGGTVFFSFISFIS